ncbi:MAG: hypothetical protein RL063_1915 [Pseudomonadota bacterium]
MKLKQLIFVFGSFYVGSVLAGPADYVYTPMVEQGEKEIDFKSGTAKQLDGTRSTVNSMGFGYGASEYWFTEVYLKREKSGSDGLSIVEWENKFQVTETGKYPVDIGLITEIEVPINNNKAPYEFKFGPLFQTEFGHVQLNGNLLFERKFGRNETNEPQNTEFGYQWQAKYRFKPEFELGMQGMGETGAWNDWSSTSNQNHRFGPAVFGKVKLAPKQAVKYNAALLFGSSQAAPNHTLRLQVEYEF